MGADLYMYMRDSGNMNIIACQDRKLRIARRALTAIMHYAEKSEKSTSMISIGNAASSALRAMDDVVEKI